MSASFSMSLDDALRQAHQELTKPVREPNTFTTTEYAAANEMNTNMAYKEILLLLARGRVERAGYRLWRFVVK